MNRDVMCPNCHYAKVSRLDRRATDLPNQYKCRSCHHAWFVSMFTDFQRRENPWL